MFRCLGFTECRAVWMQGKGKKMQRRWSFSVIQQFSAFWDARCDDRAVRSRPPSRWAEAARGTSARRRWGCRAGGAVLGQPPRPRQGGWLPGTCGSGCAGRGDPAVSAWGSLLAFEAGRLHPALSWRRGEPGSVWFPAAEQSHRSLWDLNLGGLVALVWIVAAHCVDQNGLC